MNKNTIIKILVALVVCVAAVFGIKALNQPEVVKGKKEITVIIKNQDEEICTVKENTDAELLSEFLIELSDAGSIQLEYSDSEYGMYITGLGEKELIKEDGANNLYWMYASDNNKACQATGYGCDAASAVAIENGDVFTFTLTKF